GPGDPEGPQGGGAVPDQVRPVDVHGYGVQLPADGQVVEQAARKYRGPALLGVQRAEVRDLAGTDVVGQFLAGVPLVGVRRVAGEQPAGQDRLRVGTGAAGDRRVDHVHAGVLRLEVADHGAQP